MLTIIQLIDEIKFWLHLAVLLHGPLKKNLICILHNKKNHHSYKGLPEDPSELYKELSTTHKKTLNKLVRDKVLNKSYLEILRPINGKTDSSKFDVTLITVLIINCTTLQPPIKGWNQKKPPTNDPSVAANVLLGRHWRNYLNHTDAHSIVEAVFDVKWDEGVDIVQGLGGDVSDMAALKKSSLDPKQEVVAISLLEFDQIVLDMLRKKICVLQSTTDGVDKQAKQTAGEVQQIALEVHKLQQRLDQQNKDIAADNESINNKIDEQAQQTSEETQQIAEKIQKLENEIANHNLMFDQFKNLSIEMTKIKTKMEENFIPSNRTDLKEACCKDVLIYVAEQLDDNNWHQFLLILTNDRDLIKEMKINGKSAKENVMDFFEDITFQLKWTDLEETLHNMEKSSIVDYIQKNFLYTRALQLASFKLKQHYIEEMIQWVIDQPFNLNTSGTTNPMCREKDYVDLAVLTGEQVDKEWNFDRETMMEMKHLQIQSIGIDDLWKPIDQCVVIRGVAGIGKSTLLKRYVLKWAKDEILTGKDKDEKIDFLFYFECRELNTMTNVKSFEELLKVKYPEFSKRIDLPDLQNIASRIMIIVDGLDELQGVYNEAQGEIFPMRDIVEKMINPKSTILKGHKTIIGGRYSACKSIKSKLTQTSIKMVEVCGFSEKKSIEYIEHFFGSDVQRAEKVKEIIKRPKIRVMSNVPVLLFVICLLYSEDFEEEIHTVTELYFYGLIAFLKNHVRSQENPEDSLSSFVTWVGAIVYSISTLSVKTYMDGKVTFTDDDIGAIATGLNLEATGLITKHSVGMFGNIAYQFKHLVFQEFLCALHLCLAKDVNQYSKNRQELSSCTSTILGIHHLIETEKNQLFLAFYQNLMNVHKSISIGNENISSNQHAYSNFIQQHKQMILKYIKDDEFGIDTQDYELSELMRNFKENDWLIDDKAAKKIQNSKINIDISFNKSAEVLEFLRSLNVVRLNYLTIVTKEFTEIDLDLIRMTERGSTLTVHFFMINVSFYYRYYVSDDLFVSNKRIVSNGFKSLFNTFHFKINFMKLTELTDEEILDDMFFIVSDLIEHVLDNHGNKQLTFEEYLDDREKTVLKMLIEKIRTEFEQREHFRNIEI